MKTKQRESKIHEPELKLRFTKEDVLSSEEIMAEEIIYNWIKDKTILAVFEGLMKTLPDIEGFKEIEINGLELGIITKANWDLFVVKIKDHFNSAVEELKVKKQ